jgi:hypothetical protein
LSFFSRRVTENAIEILRSTVVGLAQQSYDLAHICQCLASPVAPSRTAVDIFVHKCRPLL